MIERQWFEALRDLPAAVRGVAAAGGECPVQVEGRLRDGNHFYFRGRGENVGRWISNGSTSPCPDPGEEGYVWYGELQSWDADDDAGRMSPREGVAAISELLGRYRNPS